MGVVKADVRALKRLRDRLLELEDGDKREDFCEECAKELAARLLALVIKRTPVDTGYLRRGWTGGKSAGAKAFADSLTVEHSGDTYTIIVENPVEYASYVEYGHRTRGGGWVPGQFFLTLSEQDLESMMPAVLQKKLEAFLQEVFNG